MRLAQLVGVLFDAAELELDPVRCRLAKVLGYICRSELAPVWTWGGGRARGKGREKGRVGVWKGRTRLVDCVLGRGHVVFDGEVLHVEALGASFADNQGLGSEPAEAVVERVLGHV